MLINFTFQNFRSFKDQVTLSMESGSIKELKESVYDVGDYRLLPVAVMYGANSSGKSNVLLAIMAMRNIVLNSVRLNPKDKLDFKPFMLDLESQINPTSFEIQFLQNGIRYRYGFDFDATHICQEWLYEKRKGEREFNLFLRAENEFEVSKARFEEGLGLEKMTASNRLFISLVAQLNGEKSRNILDWFENCNYLSGIDNIGYEDKTLQMVMSHSDGYEKVLDFFHHTQLGFSNIIVTTEKSDDKFADKLVMKAQTVHTVYDNSGNAVSERAFPKDEMESEGTKKIIEISGPIFDTLKEGKLLVVDELDAKLHPLLTRSIVGLFMNKESNPNGAQLIFATHDTNLLNLSYLRRDQIWFTEKNNTESTDLYSLLEFRDESGVKVRNDRSVQKDYINGRYGAIPFLQ